MRLKSLRDASATPQHALSEGVFCATEESQSPLWISQYQRQAQVAVSPGDQPGNQRVVVGGAVGIGMVEGSLVVILVIQGGGLIGVGVPLGEAGHLRGEAGGGQGVVQVAGLPV